jgi:hypothetical protein
MTWYSCRRPVGQQNQRCLTDRLCVGMLYCAPLLRDLHRGAAKDTCSCSGLAQDSPPLSAHCENSVQERARCIAVSERVLTHLDVMLAYVRAQYVPQDTHCEVFGGVRLSWSLVACREDGAAKLSAKCRYRQQRGLWGQQARSVVLPLPTFSREASGFNPIQHHSQEQR